jgi:hypothetical protein
MNRIASFAAVLLAASSLYAQQEPGNLKLLTGLSKLQLQRYMNVMRAGLGVHCDYCHVAPSEANGNKWDFASDANPKKDVARRMIKMTMDLNANSFKGQPAVTCFTCHNGHVDPVAFVSLPQAQPPFPTPPPPDRSGYPAAKDLIAKYVAAIGGEKALPLLHAKSTVASGTRIDSKGTSAPFELREAGGNVYVKVKTADVAEQSFGPDSGWVKDKNGTRDMRPVDLEAIRDVYPAFEPFDPAMLNEKARTIRKEKIGDREAWVVFDRLDDNTVVDVFFDAATGLALRRVILTNTPIGRLPKQTNFDDYRDAAGVKLPYEVKASFVDPWIGSTRKYSEIHPGAPVDPAVFAK